MTAWLMAGHSPVEERLGKRGHLFHRGHDILQILQQKVRPVQFDLEEVVGYFTVVNVPGGPDSNFSSVRSKS